MGNNICKFSCEDTIKKIKTFAISDNDKEAKIIRASPINENGLLDSSTRSVEFGLRDISITSSNLERFGFIVEQESSGNSSSEGSKNKFNLNGGGSSSQSHSSKKKSSLFSPISINLSDYEEIYRKILLRTIQLDNFPYSKVIHLDQLMIPFPEENDLEKMKNDDYLNICIEEIKKNVNLEYNVNKFHLYTTSRKNVMKCLKDFDGTFSADSSDSFYCEENHYVGINFKVSKEGVIVIYYLYAIEAEVNEAEVDY